MVISSIVQTLIVQSGNFPSAACAPPLASRAARGAAGMRAPAGPPAPQTRCPGSAAAPAEGYSAGYREREVGGEGTRPGWSMSTPRHYSRSLLKGFLQCPATIRRLPQALKCIPNL